MNDISVDDEKNSKEIADTEDQDIVGSNSLSEEMADLKSKNEELQDKLLRTVAEMENLRRRLEKARDEARDYGIVSFAKDLLTVSDNLSRALEHKPEGLQAEVLNIISGIEMTKDELDKIFNKHHIEVIKPEVGQVFDYNLHNAVLQVEDSEYEPNRIISLMQVGYKIRDRLLRPAMVQVSKGA